MCAGQYSPSDAPLCPDMKWPKYESVGIQRIVGRESLLRRIKKISGVGCFTDCHPPQVQFEKMSFVYGENCYGKSTLCDILRSLSENDPEYVIERASVPQMGGGDQRIQISFALPEADQESVFSFRSGTWTTTMPDSMRLEVFDTEFIHRNVFTGLSVERSNHENITRFVLGESSVINAQRVATIKENLRALNRKLREVKTNTFSDIEDLPAFLTMKLEQDAEAIDSQHAELVARLDSERGLINHVDAVRSFPEPARLVVPVPLKPLVEQVATLLAATIDQAHHEAERRLLEHLENHTQSAHAARGWVQQGTAFLQDDKCPFCGRPIEGEASSLIAAYKSVFNDAFEEFARDTRAGLDVAVTKFAEADCSDISLCIERNRNALGKYSELRERPQMRQHFSAMETAARRVIEHLDLWDPLHLNLSKRLSESVRCKKEDVHVTMPPWCGDDDLAPYDALTEAVSQYNQCSDAIVECIAHFKAGLDSPETAQRLQLIERDIKTLRLQKRRIDLSGECDSYLEAEVERDALLEVAAQSEEELATEQTDFLERYFQVINTVFERLGSRHFAISAERSRRGNMPTIQLQVTFKGVPIPQNRLKALFSESDRRALALAVFWARVQTRDDEEQGRTIVVLDDPVTSFDDGRIDSTIRLIESQLPHLRQVIILSHYPGYLKTFFTRLHGGGDQPLLARLKLDENGTQLERADPLEFTETDHQLAYRRIAGFIERTHNEDVLKDLRVFLETELRSRYFHAISQNDLHGLQFAALLKELVHCKALSNTTRDAVEHLRLTLNPDHHVWSGRSHEEKIGLAEDTMRCAYEDI